MVRYELGFLPTNILVAEKLTRIRKTESKAIYEDVITFQRFGLIALRK